MLSNFRKFVFVKFISVFISFIFLFTQLELKVFAQAVLAPTQIIITTPYQSIHFASRFVDGIGQAFDYDPDGGRVRKTINASGVAEGLPRGEEKVVTYIGNLYEIESSNPVELPNGNHGAGKNTKYVFLGSERIASITTYGVAEGLPVGDNIGYAYYHTDHLGSSNLISNQDGELQQYLEYQPFGTTSKSEGSDIAKHKFTGKELDDSTGLYFYSSRYYDASICRFIQPDTIVPDPNDPQSLNRYSYCRNNPIKYTDPTGHSFWDWLGKIFGFIAGAIAGVATGNFMVGFQVFNLIDSLYTAGKTGNWGGFGAGVAGGMLGGFVGGAAAGGLSNAFIQGGINFGEGFLIGAAEMGIAGFGSGFFGALGSGADAGDAARAGGISAGISAMAGGILEGSYAAGWQDSVHFRDTRADEIKHYNDLKVNNAEAAANFKSAVGYKHMKVELGYSRITSALPDGKGYNHWGIRITDKLDNFSGQWEFDWVGKEFKYNWGKLFAGQELPGAVYFNRTPLSSFDVVGRGVEAVTKVFGNIQRNLDENSYILNQHDCRHWALEQLN